MTSGIIFLVGIGNLPNKLMAKISKALSEKLNLNLKEISATQFPDETISSLIPLEVLVQFDGDIGMMHPSGCSWLEALGNWKVPVALMIEPSLSGEIPGLAASYVSLCKQLSVPLLGLIQVGEPWIYKNRKLDGLPWCGFLPSNGLTNEFEKIDYYLIEELVIKLKQQLTYIDKYF